MFHLISVLVDLLPRPFETASSERAASRKGRCGWLWLLVAGVAVLIWWWLRKSDRSEERESVLELPPTRKRPDWITLRPAIVPAGTKPPLTPATEAPAPSDDLTRIRGIGPKIAQLLEEAGISTFVALAQADVAHVREILGERLLRLADPETWPEQARLAAAGQWEALDALQAQLRAGTRGDA